jgi:polyferredoxin
VFAWAIASRSLVELDVLKDRVLYRENEEGRIENVYTLKIMNKAQHEVTYLITADGLDGLVYEGKSEITALAGEVLSLPIELSIDPEKLPSSTNEITFRLHAADDPSIKTDAASRFIGPSVR